MKTKTTQRAFAFLACLLPTLICQPSTASAQGAAFTYQGQLANNGLPANGHYDLTFALFNNNSTATGQVGGTVTNLAVGVTNGLFTTTLDFGSVFAGAPTWLAIGVHTNGGGAFTALSALQELTPVPYAITAASAGSVSAANLTGTVALGQLPAAVLTNGASGVTVSGAFSGNGAGLTNVAHLAGGNTFNGNQVVNGNINANGTVTATNFTAPIDVQSAPFPSSQTLIEMVVDGDPYWRHGLGIVQNALGGYMATLFCPQDTSYGSGIQFSLQTSATTFNPLMTIAQSGSVGIGTTTPTQAQLVVAGSGSAQSETNFEYLNATSVGHSVAGTTYGRTYSVYTSGSIWCGGEVDVTSDARVKKVQGHSNGAADLVTLGRIEITDYTYRDTIAKGDRPHKKVIAQQVEGVFPQAVSRCTDVIPDIYQAAAFQDGWVNLATDLKVGERVRLIGGKEQGVHEVLEVRPGAFRTAFQPATEKVFVYGREVNDFRNVDYDAIAMLNVSATQELARRLAAREAEVAQLRAEKEALAAKVAVLETRDQARESRLARLESRLNASAPLVVRTSLERD